MESFDFLKKNLFSDSLETESSNLWMMLDLMTLLLIFFIYFYSSKIDSHHIITHGSPQGVTPTVHKYEKQNFNFDKEYFFEDSAFSSVEIELKSLFKEKQSSDYSVEINEQRLVLAISEKISFKSAQAELLPEIQEIMKNISKILIKYRDYKIVVSGHTDDRPINSEKFPSNWELSAARAINVAKNLIQNNVRPERISIEGYSHYQPKVLNISEINRQKNRRVEISLVKTW
jgi:chemotaxis protein MotB